MSEHLEVVKLLDAELKAKGVKFDHARLSKALTALWPHVQQDWDYSGPPIKKGDPKATLRRVQKFFEGALNTRTVAKVERAAKEPDQPALWGELTRLAIHYGLGAPLPGTVEVRMLMRVGAWRIEKAKSSRGSCRVCGRAITEGELRFGQDEKNATWFHLACGAEGAPRAFKPFAAKAAGLLAKTAKPSPAPKPGALPGGAKRALEGERIEAAPLAVLTDSLQSIGDPWGELILLAGDEKKTKQHLARHAASLTGSFGLRPFEWKMGFIDSASLQGTVSTLPAQVEELAALRTAARLRSLTISGRTDAALFKALSQTMPSTLRELRIEWPGKGIEALSLPKLRELRIRLRDLGDDQLENASLPGLRSLEIDGKSMGGGTFGQRVVLSKAFLDRLLSSRLIEQLDHLALDFGALDRAGLAHLLKRKAVLAKIRSVALPGPPWR